MGYDGGFYFNRSRLFGFEFVEKFCDWDTVASLRTAMDGGCGRGGGFYPEITWELAPDDYSFAVGSIDIDGGEYIWRDM